MVAQPRWNIYEAAMLLNAVLNVENGIEKRKDAIVRVSKSLRKMALTQNINIDEKYRNVNGITFQFQSMEFSAFGRVSPTNKTGSKMFDEVVKIKNESPDEYEQILRQAKFLAGIEDDTLEKEVNDMDYKSTFKKWLINSGKDEAAVDRIMNGFDNVSAYALNKKISVVNMWDISSIKQYTKYVHALREYKFFRVLHKELYKFFQNNSKLYLIFLKEGLVLNEATVDENKSIIEEDYAPTKVDQGLKDKYPVEIKNIYQILKQDTKHAFLTTEQIASMAGCNDAVAAIILNTASWSEALGDGFVFGNNSKYRINKQIEFSVDKAYKDDTKEEKILKSAFRRGFRIHSIMDRKRFINLFEERYGEAISDDEVISRISKISFSFDDRLFLPKAIVDRTTAVSICQYIEHYFEQKEILFYDVLFKKYKEMFNSFVYCPEMLAEYIKFTIEGTPLFYSEKYFSYSQRAKPDIASEVIDYLIRADRPCSYDEIYAAMAHLNREDVYSVIHYNNPEILGNSKTEYFHIEVAHVSPRERSVLESYCKRLLERSRYITCNEVIEHLPQIDIELYGKCEGKFSTLGLRRILTYYLRTDFDVMTGVITKKGEQMTIKEVFADYAQNHSSFTVDDIQELASYTGTVPYWDAVHSNAIRINGDDFVSDSMVDFDVDAVDDAIAFYCSDYIPLAGIVDYMRFPSCGYSWNIYLLQEYVYRFSKMFKLESLGFAKGNASGVIVKKNLGYLDFDAIITEVLSKTSITTKQDALNYLCDCGFITDRRYKKVEELLKKAMVLRKNRK